MKATIHILLLAATLLAGCSGEYILAAPDVAGVPGDAAPVVVRLQRREFWFHAPPEEGIPVRFDLASQVQRAGRTDEDGYTGVAIRIPQTPGKYLIGLNVQDVKGDTAKGEALVYALDANAPILAVDLDALPQLGPAVNDAAHTLARLQSQAQIIYLTQGYARKPAKAHDVLSGAGYPEGPVLPWRKSSWWQRRRWWGGSAEGEALVDLKTRLPRLQWGLTDNSSAARTLTAAGVEPLVVGWKLAGGGKQFDSWNAVTLTGEPHVAKEPPPPAAAPTEGKRPWWKRGWPRRAKRVEPAEPDPPAEAVVTPPSIQPVVPLAPTTQPVVVPAQPTETKRPWWKFGRKKSEP